MQKYGTHLYTLASKSQIHLSKLQNNYLIYKLFYRDYRFAYQNYIFLFRVVPHIG